ncbi:hypothetical protein [Alicyclobacillus sp. SO9]|uniref:hypothetical protein n=1 Tax=Alicyclobacillus sp. SO9 TaxID=2665646 RepID=UPI001E53E374|nr:hypothetical protein [Alicyclobacillus sp. SO9]
MRKTLWGELLAEFIGTFALMAFGDGVVAVAVAGLTESGRTQVIFQGAGGWLLITLGLGIGCYAGHLCSWGRDRRTYQPCGDIRYGNQRRPSLEKSCALLD